VDINDVLVVAIIMGGLIILAVLIGGALIFHAHLARLEERRLHQATLTPKRTTDIVVRGGYDD
jgi:hypothetical protein